MGKGNGNKTGKKDDVDGEKVENGRGGGSKKQHEGKKK